MTIQQLIAMAVVTAVALAAVVYFTRPTGRRFAGALAGGVFDGVLALGAIIPLGEWQGWWRVPLDPSPTYMGLVFFALAVSTAPIFLVTWRIARRFGWRGLAVLLAVAALLGPPREFFWEARFPEWITYAPGAPTFLALSVVYVVALSAGHGLMRLVAGPARGSHLARWPWEAAEPGAAADGGA